MFSSDHNIETINQLCVEIKKYVELRGKCLQLDFVSKMTSLLTALVVMAIVFVAGTVVILFLSLSLASALSPYVGGPVVSYGIVGLAFMLLFLVVLGKRKSWIEAPIANFLGHLFLDNGDSADKK